MKNKFDKTVDAINSGVDETKVACKVLISVLAPVSLLGIYVSAMMEQWLIEGRFSEKETLMLSCDMLAGGLNTVNLSLSLQMKQISCGNSRPECI